MPRFILLLLLITASPLLAQGGPDEAPREEDGDPAAPPATLTPTPPDGVEVSIQPPDAGWVLVENTEAPVRLRYAHAELDATLTLFVLDALEFDDDPGDLSALTILADWDGQFRGAGPLVEIVEHEPAHKLSKLVGTYGHLHFRSLREGLYFGFTSEALARTHSATLTWDRFAFFILVEGPVEHEDTLRDAFHSAIQHLEGHL